MKRPKWKANYGQTNAKGLASFRQFTVSYQKGGFFMMGIFFRKLIIVSLSISLLGLGCSGPTLNSSWRTTHSGAVNASVFWEEGSKYTVDDKPVEIGFQNDDENFYIFVQASDRETQMRVMRSGLTIWLDSSGKKNKKFGVRYPLGMGARRMERNAGERLSGEMARPPEEMSAAADTLEIIGPKANEHRKAPIENELGLTVTQIKNMGARGYEFVIPLKASNGTPYAIGANSGGIIGVGFEIPELKRAGMEKGERPGGGMEHDGDRPSGPPDGDGGGFGGPGGGPPGGGSGGPGGRGGPRGGGQRPDGQNGETSSGAIKLWIKVKLAGQSAEDEPITLWTAH
jgi:hypothetical protein